MNWRNNLDAEVHTLWVVKLGDGKLGKHSPSDLYMSPKAGESPPLLLLHGVEASRFFNQPQSVIHCTHLRPSLWLRITAVNDKMLDIIRESFGKDKIQMSRIWKPCRCLFGKGGVEDDSETEDVTGCAVGLPFQDLWC